MRGKAKTRWPSLGPHYSTRSKHATIRSAALPSQSGGIALFFHCPAINRASAGESLLGSVPMSSFVPIVMVSGRSVVSRRLSHGLGNMSGRCVMHPWFSRYSNGKTRALARWGSTEISAPSSSWSLNCLIAGMSTR